MAGSILPLTLGCNMPMVEQRGKRRRHGLGSCGMGSSHGRSHRVQHPLPVRKGVVHAWSLEGAPAAGDFTLVGCGGLLCRSASPTCCLFCQCLLRVVPWCTGFGCNEHDTVAGGHVAYVHMECLQQLYCGQGGGVSLGWIKCCCTT